MPTPSLIRKSVRCIPARCKPMRPGPSCGKKAKHGDPVAPVDRELGSWWDHVLLDAESRLIVTRVVGRRNFESVLEAFAD